MGYGLKTNNSQVKMKLLNTSDVPLNEKIDNVGSSIGGSSDNNNSTLMGKINSLITSIASIFTNTQTNNAASASGTLSQKMSHSHNLLTTLSNTVASTSNSLSTQILGWLNGGQCKVIKSIQRGYDVKNSSYYKEERSITIPNTVNPNKSIVLLDEPHSYDTGGYSSDYNHSHTRPVVKTFNGKVIEIEGGYEWYDNDSDSRIKYPAISWQVIEFY